MKKFLFFITLFTIFNLQSEDKLLKCDGLYSSPELNQIIGGDKDAGDFVISRSTIKSFILFKFNEQKASASIKLYEDLTKMNYSVLLDDRKDGYGTKIKDSELVGIPLNIVIGKNYLENKEVELIGRNGEKSTNPISDIKEILDFFK